jgi:hypothetical protein
MRAEWNLVSPSVNKLWVDLLKRKGNVDASLGNKDAHSKTVYEKVDEVVVPAQLSQHHHLEGGGQYLVDRVSHLVNGHALRVEAEKHSLVVHIDCDGKRESHGFGTQSFLVQTAWTIKKIENTRKMPLNSHLIEFNSAKSTADQLGLDEFVFRGKSYHRGQWTNGVPVWYSSEYRGSKKKKKKKKKKKSEKSKKSKKSK